MGFPLYVTCCFSLAAFNILSLCLVFVSLISVCLGMFLLGCILYWTLCASWTCVACIGLFVPLGLDYFLFHVGEIFSSNLFKNFLISFLFLFFFWDPYNSNVGAFNIVPGSLPISSSFIWTSVFLVCSFICVVFLCLFITFLTYYDWGLLFPGFKVEFFFFFPFGFCPPGWDFCWVYVFLLFHWWAGLSEVEILSADDWVCIFVLFVV